MGELPRQKAKHQINSRRGKQHSNNRVAGRGVCQQQNSACYTLQKPTLQNIISPPKLKTVTTPFVGTIWDSN